MLSSYGVRPATRGASFNRNGLLGRRLLGAKAGRFNNLDPGMARMVTLGAAMKPPIEEALSIGIGTSEHQRDVAKIVRDSDPLVLKYELTSGDLYIGVDGALDPERPGNGGMRVMNYEHADAAVDEVSVLATTMTAKHSVFNTGFGGAKLVLHAHGDITEIEKEELMKEVGIILNGLDGAVVTGCDLNTSADDMECLMQHSPHVLASVGCPVDPNFATGEGVFASAVAAMEYKFGSVAGRRVLVKGCGKVGGALASCLLAAGATVLTYDIIKEAADIPGAINVSDQDWASVECDVFCPCSTTGFIDIDASKRLSSQILVGSCNAPFASDEAMRVLESRGIMYVHEAISSAGAVLCDSIERFDAESYDIVRPASVYGFIRHLAATKTKQLMREAERRGIPGSMALKYVQEDPSSNPIGVAFKQWLSNNTEEFDVAIVGGGMAGSSTAYWLSEEARDLKGIVLESTSVAHEKGSSYGESRMFREMYSDPYFARMQRASLQLWDEVEQRTGETLLKRNGLLFYGEETEETVEGSVQGARDTMEELGIAHEYFDSGDALREKWPEMSPGEHEQGVFEPSAGSINSSKTCHAMMRVARENGWTLREGVRVEDIHRVGPGSIELFTSDGRRIRARRVVLAAGAWTNELLKYLSLRLDLEVWNVAWGHYEVDPDALSRLPQWFHFEPEMGSEKESGVQATSSRERHSWDGGLIYGFPPEDPETAQVKVGVDFTPDDPRFRTKDMASFRYQAHPDIANIVDDFLQHGWKDGTFRKRTEFVCSPYSMTKDNYFVLDRLPDAPEISLFAGGCGRAFKFAPLLGKCLAELTLDRELSWDVSPFSVQRQDVKLERLLDSEVLTA